MPMCLSVYQPIFRVCVCVCLSVCHIHRSIMSTFVFCVRMAIYHWYRSLLVCTPVCHTPVFSQHIHNFYRATHMHSADYTVTTCLSDRLSIWLSIRQTCTHVFLFSLFLYLYTVTFIRTMSVFCVHMSVCSYVSVCLSATFIYRLLYVPFYVSIFIKTVLADGRLAFHTPPIVAALWWWPLRRTHTWMRRLRRSEAWHLACVPVWIHHIPMCSTPLDWKKNTMHDPSSLHESVCQLHSLCCCSSLCFRHNNVFLVNRRILVRL